MTFSSQDVASAIRGGFPMRLIDKRRAAAVAMREALGYASSLADAWASPDTSGARRRRSAKKIADALDALDAYEVWCRPDGKAPGSKGRSPRCQG